MECNPSLLGRLLSSGVTVLTETFLGLPWCVVVQNHTKNALETNLRHFFVCYISFCAPEGTRTPIDGTGNHNSIH